jgi:hypothetical protein
MKEHFFLNSLLSMPIAAGLALSVFLQANQMTVKSEQFPSHMLEEESVQMKPDGTKFIKKADGSSVEIRPDGTKIIQEADGTFALIMPDGTKIIKKTDGTSIQIKRDGTKIIKKVDGSKIELKPGK